MKVGLAQFNPKVGDVPGNKKRIIEWIEKARGEGVRLLVFPELAIVGYPPRDLLDYSDLVDANLKALEEIGRLSNGIALVVGYVERNHKGYGKPFHNAAALFDGGRRIGTYFKQLLPYYDVFEEERYFDWGKADGIFTIDGKKIALTICEDLWNEPGYLKRPYNHHPLQGLQNQNLDLLVNISASPFHVGKPQSRVELFRSVSKKVGAPVVFCNQVGANDELVFDGSSMVIGKDGKVMATAPAFQETLLIDTLATWPKEKAEWIHEALVLGIRDYVHKSGMKSVCLGLSGGIDSSVVAVLAVKALGKENVLGVALPTRFNTSASNDDAQAIAKNLGMEFSVFPIESIFEKYESALGKVSSLTLENIQPRIRMTILMAFSNERKSLLLNTSNKSEIATGFATLYGDSSGALSVLGDLTKHEVYDLARFINSSREIIPSRVIDRVPTAELRENQTDQDTLPPYDELDDLVVETVERTHVPSKTGSGQIFSRLHALSEYKRRQLPPVIRVSPRAFGMGRRIPVVSTKPTEI